VLATLYLSETTKAAIGETGIIVKRAIVEEVTMSAAATMAAVMATVE
jgi:hypothetical protein